MNLNSQKCQYYFGLITDITAHLLTCNMTVTPDPWSSPSFYFTCCPGHRQQLGGSGPGRHFTFDPSLGFNSVTSEPQLRLVLHLNHSEGWGGPPLKLIYSPRFSWLKMMAPPLFFVVLQFGVLAWVINGFEDWPAAAETFPGGPHI